MAIHGKNPVPRDIVNLVENIKIFVLFLRKLAVVIVLQSVIERLI